MSASAELVSATVPGGSTDNVVELSGMSGHAYRMSGLPVEAGKFTLSIWVAAESQVSLSFEILGTETDPVTIRGGYQWERRVFVLEVQEEQNTGYIDCIPAANTHIRLYKAKFEKGILATDWTAAPEDLDVDLSIIEQRITSAEEKITDSAIQDTVFSSQEYITTVAELRKDIPQDYAKEDDLLRFRQEYSAFSTLTDEQLELAFNAVNTLQNITTGLNGTLKTISDTYTKYFRFGLDGMYIGDPNCSIYLRLDNDRISFYTNGGGEVAYLSNDKLYITNAQFIAHMRIGNFEFDIDDNDDLVLYYVV